MYQLFGYCAVGIDFEEVGQIPVEGHVPLEQTILVFTLQVVPGPTSL
jgi:hypothetical protein